MTDRFDEMAQAIAQKITTSGDDYIAGSQAIATALRAVDADAEKRGSKAGQEAMRERAAQVCDGCRYADTAAADIRSLPLEES